ncbi:RluA family pseudouridine synthase [Konateibacter massiliensis]|uniref:RluA family pseudouridine synthase n=1 Tax=Konateibacter massiliensis TaxID=2002841 RepID=UPI000C156B68|nr:RluA family pseudouridine synthase [Konateibacter massiliensis]
MNIKTTYEDKSIIIVQKQSGIAVETAKIGEIDMVSQLRTYRQERENDSYIGVVHRLDQPVEGILVFAKTKEAAAALSRQISQGEMKKYYLALLCGTPKEQEKKLEDYLLKNGKTNTSAVVKKGNPQAKRSELFYKILGSRDGISLAEIELFTGRHHQIRVQMANAGLPLWGDTKYNKEFAGQRGVNPALCAYKLVLTHPVTKEVMTFQAAPVHEMFGPYATLI